MRPLLGWLLGKAPLGMGQGGGVGHQADFTAPPYYLMRDAFDTDRAQGSVEGAPADPGPGTIAQITDAGSDINISGGTLNLPSQNERVWYSGVNRRAGVAMRWTVDTAALTNNGWADALGNIATTAHGIGVIPGGDIRIYDNNSFAVAGTYTTETEWCSILREVGAMALVKRAGHWLLLYFTASENSAVMYPSFATIVSGALEVSLLAVPAKLWLPAPLVSDGFSAWGASDGLGHAEGIAGGIGSGGGGVEWTAAVGTWGAAAGKAAATALSGGIALATASTAVDVLASVKVTRTAGKAGLVLRRGGTTNYVYVVVTGTHVQVYKRISNTETNLQDIATTNVDGARLRVIVEGTAFRIYYNDLFVVSVTIADASVQSSPLVGLYTTDTANTFDDFTAYARGTGGEYDAILDAI